MKAKSPGILPIGTPLLFLMLNLTLSQAQTAQILHYGGTALPSGSATDTAFCKGQAYIEIHGTAFMTVPAPWLWDSITLTLGGFPIPINFLLDTEIHTAFPDTFQRGACPVLEITQHVHAGASTSTFQARDTICIVGDDVTINYPPDPWCIGHQNPVPSIQLSPETVPGAFCCQTAPGLIVLPNGEIPLHAGATGTVSWQYQSGHPQCAVTLTFTSTIFAPTTSTASIGGAVALNVCQSAPMLRADDPFPPGGRFVCDDQGLVILDDSAGLISPRLSRPNTYVLRYEPSKPCASVATITITVQPSPGASIVVAAACDGLPVEVVASSDGYGGLSAYHWSINDSAFEASSAWDAHTFPALQDGDSVGVVVENFFGCVDTAGVRVQVRPRPFLALAPHGAVMGVPVWEVVSNLDNTVLGWSLSETGLGSASSELIADGAVSAGTAGAWVDLEPGAALPGYLPSAFSQLCIAVSGEAGGCPADTVRDCAEVVPPSGTSSASVTEGGTAVFVPEVMTPNGDGANDVWELRWPESVRGEDFVMELFNRSGGRVLWMQGLVQGWDGGNNPDGVYWWTLSRGGVNVDKGGLTIRRK